MQNDEVHKPELPGVRTLTKDAPEESGFSMGGITFTVPEKTVDTHATAHTDSHREKKGVFDVERAFNNEMVQEGTIVTDHKRKRLSVGTMVVSAFTEWWRKTQSSLESTVEKVEVLKPKEKPKIETALVRAGTIKQAAQYAKQAPRDDHTIVVEKVRTFAHDAEAVTGKPFVIKEAPGEQAPGWKKNEEVQKEAPKAVPPPASIPTLDLRETAVAPVIHAHTNTPLSSYTKSVPPREAVVSAPRPIVTEKPSIKTFSVPEKMSGGKPLEKKDATWSFFKGNRKSALDLRTKVSTPPRPEPSVPRTEAPTFSTHRESVPHTIPTPREVTPQNGAAPLTETPRGVGVISNQTQEKNTTTTPGVKKTFHGISPRLLYGTIILVGGGLGVLAAVFMVQSLDPNEPAPQTVVEVTVERTSLIPSDNSESIPLTKDKETYYALLLEKMRGSQVPLTEFVPIDETGEAIPARDFFTALDVRAPGSLVRSFDDAFMLGSVRVPNPEPFILVRAPNFDVAFSGMLAWERHMVSDLTPLFGTIPESATRFVDAVKGNRSVRLLEDDTGRTHIVYAFVNEETIIITTHAEALSVILERLK